MEIEYDKCHYPNYKEKKRISKEHELDLISVHNWFNMRRSIKCNENPRTEPEPSTSFQLDEDNYFDIQHSRSEKQVDNQDETDLTPYYQPSMFLVNEITSQGQHTNMDNNENSLFPCLFDQQNSYNLNLESFQFSEQKDYSESKTNDGQNNISTVNMDNLPYFDQLQESSKDEHNIMQYFNTDNEPSVLNDQPEQTPSTSLNNQQ